MFRMVFPLILFSFVTSLTMPLAFSQAVSFSTSSSSNYSGVHADFNSDGREDFIVSSGCPSTGFGLVLSTANGTYAAPVCYSLPSGEPYSYAIADFNGDGYPDVIICDGTTTLYEYLGSASGQLQLQPSITVSGEVEQLAAADVNHDGKVDVVYDTITDTNLHVLFSDGKGGFTVGPTTAMSVVGFLYLGDFDGDGNADIFSEYNLYSSSYQVFYGDGTGHFQASATWGDDVQYMPYDLNGDGRMDLVGSPFDFSINGDTYYNDVRVLYGNANRTFTTQNIPLANCTPWDAPVGVADFNGDGINDLVVTEASDCKGHAPDTVNVLLGNPNGTFQPEQALFQGNDSQLLSFPSILRANPDARADFLVFDLTGSVPEEPGFLFENTTIGKFPKCSAPGRYDGITLCSPTRSVVATSPVRFSIGAANQTAGRKVEVWVDGKKMGEQLKDAFSYDSFLDATYNLSAGNHTVTVYSAGWDNLLESLTFPLDVGSTTCTPPNNPGLNVCSPLNDSTLGTTALAWAAGTVTGTIARMEVWVDGVKEYSTFGANTLKTNLPLTAGSHTFNYYIVNTAGQKWEQTVYASVP